MTKEHEPVSKKEYETFLQTLKSLGDASKLSRSSLINSQLTANYVENNPLLSPHEALRNVLTEILDQLILWSPILGEILRARFWEQRTVDEMSTLGIPKPYAPRTILDKQRQGVYQLAAWFIEKEKRLHDNKEPSDTIDDKLIPAPIKKYLEDFPQFNAPHSIGAQYVSTSRESFFSALRHIMQDLALGDYVFTTDNLNVEKSFVMYWVTEGLEYLRINHEAAMRGVKINRAFIINSADKSAHRDFLKNLILLHYRAGALPLVVDVEQLPADYLREFIYVKDKFVDEVIYDFRSIEVIDNYIHWSPHKLALFKERANFVRGFADPIWQFDTPPFESFEQVEDFANKLRSEFFQYANTLN